MNHKGHQFKFLTFIVCILLSGFLWITIQLRQKYTIDLSLPVTYLNIKEANVLVSKLPHAINLKVSGGGLALLLFNLNYSKQKIFIDVNDFTNVTHSFDSLKTIDVIAKLIKPHNQITIKEISPNILKFETVFQAEKIVPISFKTTFKLPKHVVLLDSIQWSHATVTITGPQKILDSITSIETRDVAINININKTEYAVAFKNYGSDVLILNKKLEAFVHTDVLIEETLVLPVKVREESYQKKYTIIPSTVKVRYLVPSQKAYAASNIMPIEVYVIPNKHTPYVIPQTYYTLPLKQIRIEPNVVKVFEVQD